MKLKNKKQLKNKFCAFRCTEKDFYNIKRNALLYSEGNISEYMLYAALNYKVLNSDLETGRTRKRAPKK